MQYSTLQRLDEIKCHVLLGSYSETMICGHLQILKYFPIVETDLLTGTLLFRTSAIGRFQLIMIDVLPAGSKVLSRGSIFSAYLCFFVVFFSLNSSLPIITHGVSTKIDE